MSLEPSRPLNVVTNSQYLLYPAGKGDSLVCLLKKNKIPGPASGDKRKHSSSQKIGKSLQDKGTYQDPAHYKKRPRNYKAISEDDFRE